MESYRLSLGTFQCVMLSNEKKVQILEYSLKKKDRNLFDSKG